MTANANTFDQFKNDKFNPLFDHSDDRDYSYGNDPKKYITNDKLDEKDLESSNDNIENYSGYTTNEKPSLKENVRKITIAVLMITGLCAAYSLSNKNKINDNPNVLVAGASADPGNKEKASANIPEEAQEFIEKYSNRYGGDTLSTLSAYYSNERIKGANSSTVAGDGYVMSDKYIKDNIELKEKVDLIADNELGFIIPKVPADKLTKVNQTVSIEMFNEFVVPNANEYMNWLCKNLNLEGATDVLYRKFFASFNLTPILKYDTVPPNGVEYERFMTLKGVLDKIVTRYGGDNPAASTFQILDASTEDNGKNSVFNNTQTYVGYNDSEKPDMPTGWTDNINMLVKITTNDGNKTTEKIVPVTDCSLTAEINRNIILGSCFLKYGMDQVPRYGDVGR